MGGHWCSASAYGDFWSYPPPDRSWQPVTRISGFGPHRAARYNPTRVISYFCAIALSAHDNSPGLLRASALVSWAISQPHAIRRAAISNCYEFLSPFALLRTPSRLIMLTCARPERWPAKNGFSAQSGEVHGISPRVRMRISRNLRARTQRTQKKGIARFLDAPATTAPYSRGCPKSFGNEWTTCNC